MEKMEAARVELKNVFDEYKKLKKYNKENNIRAYSNPIPNKIGDWVEKYKLIVMSKDEIDDLYFRIFDLGNTEEVDYDLFNQNGSYVNIRKEFGLE